MTNSLIENAARYAYLVDSGCVWQAKSATTACVIAVPTTACMIGLQNGESDGGKSCVILNVGAIQIASDASMCTLALIYSTQLIRPATAFTKDVVPTNVRPRVGTYGGLAAVDNNPTVVDNGWFPIGKHGALNIASLFGGNIWEDIYGQLVIPPGGAIAFHCIANAVAVTVQISITWAEIKLT